MHCLVPSLCLLLAAGFDRAEQVLVNLTHAPVQVQVTSVLARGGTLEMAVHPHGTAASAEPAHREYFTEDGAFCGHAVRLPPGGAIVLRTCRDPKAPQAIQQARMTIVPADDAHRDVSAFESRGLLLVYRAQAEGSGRVAETFDPTFLSRDLPIDVEGPDDLDGRLRLVDPEHGCCCCAIL